MLAANRVQSTTDAGTTTTVGPRIVVERPPPGLARGKYAWPAWGIGLVGGTIVVIGLGYLVWRFLRLRRR